MKIKSIFVAEIDNFLQNPSKNMHVVHYDIRPGYEGHFENVLLAAKTYLENSEGAPNYTWYEKAVGGAGPHFMLFVPFSRCQSILRLGFHWKS